MMTTCRRIPSVYIFQIVVGGFTRMTLRGQACKMLSVACHHLPKAIAMRNARRSWGYMAGRAHNTPTAMQPCPSCGRSSRAELGDEVKARDIVKAQTRHLLVLEAT